MARTLPINDDIPPPPPLRPTWTTWMYIGFAIAVVILGTIGFINAGQPFAQ